MSLFVKSTHNVTFNPKAEVSKEIQLPSKAAKIKVHKNQTRQDDFCEIQENDLLIESLRLLPSISWAEGFLDAAKMMIEILQLSNDDPRLVLSLPKNKRIAFTINQRYVLAVAYPKRSHIGLIVENGYSPDEIPGYVNEWAFKPDDVWIHIDSPDHFKIPDNIFESWQNAAKKSCGMAKKSIFRKNHRPQIYKLITNSRYRKKLLNLAFS